MPLAMPAWDSTPLGVNRRELKALFNARKQIKILFFLNGSSQSYTPHTLNRVTIKEAVGSHFGYFIQLKWVQISVDYIVSEIVYNVNRRYRINVKSKTLITSHYN